MSVPRHYKTSDLADLLSCNAETIRRLALRGEIASIRLGGELRFPEHAVQQFLERAKTPARRQVEAAVVPIAARRDDRDSRPRRTG